MYITLVIASCRETPALFEVVIVRGRVLVKIFVDVLSVSNNCYFNRVVSLIKISNNPIITNSKLVITSPCQSFKEMEWISFVEISLLKILSFTSFGSLFRNSMASSSKISSYTKNHPLFFMFKK